MHGLDVEGYEVKMSVPLIPQGNTVLIQRAAESEIVTCCSAARHCDMPKRTPNKNSGLVLFCRGVFRDQGRRPIPEFGSGIVSNNFFRPSTREEYEACGWSKARDGAATQLRREVQGPLPPTACARLLECHKATALCD